MFIQSVCRILIHERCVWMVDIICITTTSFRHLIWQKKRNETKLQIEVCLTYVAGSPFVMVYRGYYVIDLSLVHAIIFILPCIILALFKLWTKLVAKRQAEIITRKLNEELVKLVWEKEERNHLILLDSLNLYHLLGCEIFWLLTTITTMKPPIKINL